MNHEGDHIEDLPLIPEGGCHEEEGDYLYDEDGSMSFDSDLDQDTDSSADHIPLLAPFRTNRACSRKVLDGSWLLNIFPGTGRLAFGSTRGPMRIESKGSSIRVSGDVYVSRPVLVGPVLGPVTSPPRFVPAVSPLSLVLNRNWYPAYPKREYRWYFRSRGVRYRVRRGVGTLIFRFTRHLWSNSQQDFISEDSGWMRFSCTRSIFELPGLPQSTIKMTGTAMIGRTSYRVEATKTSPYYRGCLVEADVMVNRTWPSTANSCNGSRVFNFTGVFRQAGMDFRANVNDLNVPEDSRLTSGELHALMNTHRSLVSSRDSWRIWVLVGSRRQIRPGTLGLMFDQIAPHREGCVGFFDPVLPNFSTIHVDARNKKLGDVKLAFLRTLIHEAGHCFNLFHPKADVHDPDIGTTIMNQTGDVIGFADTTNPYPCNATLGFNSHNRTSLIHSPDPQVKPGWKEFGWGHGSASGGLPEPVDADGIEDKGSTTDALRLDVSVPAEVHVGEYFTAEVKVVNDSNTVQKVTSSINLAEGDLQLHVLDSDGKEDVLRDIVYACGDRRMVELEPGQDITTNVQIVYTNRQFKFDRPGNYQLEAELQVGNGHTLYSKPVTLSVREASTKKEKEICALMLHDDVGVSLALGDFGTSDTARKNLTSIMDKYDDTDTGGACAMIIANSFGESFRDIMQDKVVRKKDTKKSEDAWDVAIKGRSATSMTCLASSVVSPGETDRMIIQKLKTHLKGAKTRSLSASSSDRKEALKLLEDFLA